MKKVIFLSVIWTVILLGIFFFLQADGTKSATGPPPIHYVVISTVIVLLIFAADVLILWILSKIGGPLKADVKATIKKFGGSLAIAGAGLVGCFLAIAITAFAGIYIIERLMSR